MRLRFIGILAVLAMIMAFAATPVAADHGSPTGEGTADCPEGTTFIVNFTLEELNALSLEEGDEIFEGVFFVEYVFKDGTDEVIGITVLNETGGTITLAVKGANDQVGNASDPILDGEEGTIIVAAQAGQSGKPAGLSNLSICAGPETGEDLSASLTIAKDADGNTTEVFNFNGFTLVGGGSTTMEFETDDFTNGEVEVTITETLTPAQLAALWELVDIQCDADADIDVEAGTLTITLMDGDDVTCTFFNEQGTVTVLSPSLSLDKVVTSGNVNAAFSFTLNNASLNPITAAQPAILVSQTAGVYTIVELAQTGWNLRSIECTGNATAEVVTPATRTVTVTVGADEDVVCTFTNAPGNVQTGGGGPSQVVTASRAPVRSGTLANTAMENGPADQAPALVLALVALGSLAFVARRNIAAIKQRN